MKEKQLKGKDLISYLMVRFNYTLKEALAICIDKGQISKEEAQEVESYLNLNK
jgi:hypothetical protein